MKILYTGPFPQVSVTDPETGIEYPATRGEPIEVPDALGRALRPSPDWKEPRRSEKPDPTPAN